MPAVRVLIVDDQPSFRRHLRRLLAYAGLEVIAEAGNIPEAEELALHQQPDLAVVDVVLPGISGLDGVARLRAAAPGLRVFLVSAYRDQARAFQDAARRSGAEGFLLKDEVDLPTVRAWLVEG